MTAHRLHRFNAIFLAVFIAAHFATHLSGLWGVETYNAVQNAVRIVYRQPLIEILILASAALQAGLGIKLLISAARRGVVGIWSWIQVTSGAVFLIFLVEHLIALGFARLAFGLDTNFYWPASVMSGPPFTWYFIPYYFLGVLALFVHVGSALRWILVDQGRIKTAAVTFWTLTLVGTVISGLIVAMLLGTFFEINLPPEWIEYLRVFYPTYGK
jgi:succinate dehydrogenase/fumarate reductase cytochrome b subunit